jgi:hypothetical protein
MSFTRRTSLALLAVIFAFSTIAPVEAQTTRTEIRIPTPISMALPINGTIPTSTDAVTPADNNMAATPPSSVLIEQQPKTDVAAPILLQGQAAAINISTVDIIVIDNDEEKGPKLEESYKWSELPDAPGKTHISAGAKFPVVIVSQHSSKTAAIGDPVEARLKVDVKIGGKLIAPKGTRVVGHISSVKKARRMIQAEFAMNKRWMRPSGVLGIQLDEIVTANGDHIPLVANPARTARIIKNTNEGRILGVNHNGEVTSPLSIQVKHQALHLAIRAGATAAGPFSFGIVPVAYATIGAIYPSFAFMQPVGKNMHHRRLKGAALGLIAGLPGGFLVADTIIRGPEAKIKPGDEFLAELKQDFTGEALTEAELLARSSTRVHGQIINPEKSPKR